MPAAQCPRGVLTSARRNEGAPRPGVPLPGPATYLTCPRCGPARVPAHRVGRRVSGAVIAEIVPVLPPAPLAGAVAGRLPRVRAMVGADLRRTALNPAAACVLPAIVDEQKLVAASSGLWAAAVASQVALAPLGGALDDARPRRSGSLRDHRS